MISAPIQECDVLYQQEKNEMAFSCYLDLIQNPSQSSESPSKLDLYERQFIALSRLGEKRTAIDSGLAALQQMEKEFSNTSHYLYWQAVFLSFDAQEKDQGRPLPTAMFKVLKQIQKNLTLAISMDPTVHAYGPNRVLGVMHTAMPRIVGGDKTLAEKMLKVAYENAPRYATNWVAYAKILEMNGKEKLAKTILQQFLEMGDEALNPYPNETLRLPKVENEIERKEAKKLLSDWNED